jgi:hypothetical protein
MGGRASKQKGNGFEREIVDLLRVAGIKADRVPLSGAVAAFPGDVRFDLRGEQTTAECKRRKRGYKTMYGHLGNNRVLFVRDDHCEALAVMRAEDFAKLVGSS